MNVKKSAPMSVAADYEGNEQQPSGIDYEKYRQTIRKEKEWRGQNKELWRHIETWALNEARHRRKFAVQQKIEEIRWKDYVNDAGQSVKVSNNYGAIWTRLLVAMHPEIRPFVTMKKSVFDEMEIVP